MSEELKPCPFCGGDDLLIYTNEIWCKKCDAGIHGGDYGEKTQQIVIEQWNTRTNDKEKL